MMILTFHLVLTIKRLRIITQENILVTSLPVEAEVFEPPQCFTLSYGAEMVKST